MSTTRTRRTAPLVLAVALVAVGGVDVVEPVLGWLLKVGLAGRDRILGCGFRQVRRRVRR